MVIRSIVGGLAAIVVYLPGASLAQSGLQNFTFRDLVAGQPQSVEQIREAKCSLTTDSGNQHYCYVHEPAIANIPLSYYSYYLYNGKLTKFGLSAQAGALEPLKIAFNAKYGAPCRVKRLSRTWTRDYDDGRRSGDVIHYDEFVWCFASGELEMSNWGGHSSTYAVYKDTVNIPGKQPPKVDF